MRPGLEYGYSAAAAANHQRMNWPPALHPSAAWPYDYAAYSAAYPASSDLRSPSAYHLTSPTGLSPQHQQSQQQQQASSTDQNGATRHNIADILGGQTDNLQSEIAKTGGAGYQKSPTTSTAANMFSPTSATPEHVRSPTTPTHPHMVYHHHPGAGEVPANFYIPAALPRGLPGKKQRYQNAHTLSRYESTASLLEPQWFQAKSKKGLGWLLLERGRGRAVLCLFSKANTLHPQSTPFLQLTRGRQNVLLV